MRAARLSWVVLFGLIAGSAFDARASAVTTSMSARLAALPLRFEANRGQLDPHVSFMARGSGYALFLTPEGATLALHRKDSASVEQSSVLKMRVVGGHAVRPSPSVLLPGSSNYFVGNDPSKWRTGIEAYGHVHYSEVLPGVDIVYYGAKQSQLEYDVVLAPGSNPGSVAFAFEGAEGVEIEPDGAARLRLPGGSEIVQPPPVAYQLDAAGRRERVDVRYELRERALGFAVGRFDARRALVIDPALLYSTYLGGTASEGVDGIAVDAAGEIVIAGTTSSTNFPTISALQSTYGGGPHDAFVAKINAAGSALVYSTYLGGSGDDYTNGLAIDASGNAFVTGHTTSTNFPTFAPLQGASGGADDAFVTKLNAAGSALLYSTYLGGSGNDQAKGVAIDTAGDAFIAGFTSSTNFPTTTGALQDINKVASLSTTGFVAKINAAGSSLDYSTYLGGSTAENANGIALDGAGDAFVVGFTSSINFPVTASALQVSYGGGATNAFVAKLNPAGSALLYATYLGGSGAANTLGIADEGNGIALDAAGEAVVAGYTTSANFPTHSPLQGTLTGPQNAFVAKLNSAGSGLVYSSYLGGSGTDFGNGIAVDGAGEAFVTGYTNSSNFPTVSAFQSVNAGKNDSFVTKFNAAGSALVYSTYLGGSDNDDAYCIAIDTSGDAIIGGETASTNLQAVSAFQSANAGKDDAFVAKVAPSSSVAVAAPALGSKLPLLAALLLLSGFLALANGRRGCTIAA